MANHRLREFNLVTRLFLVDYEKAMIEHRYNFVREVLHERGTRHHTTRLYDLRATFAACSRQKIEKTLAIRLLRTTR